MCGYYNNYKFFTNLITLCCHFYDFNNKEIAPIFACIFTLENESFD